VSSVLAIIRDITAYRKTGYSAKFVGKKYTGGDYIWGSTPDPEVLGGIRTISE